MNELARSKRRAGRGEVLEPREEACVADELGGDAVIGMPSLAPMRDHHARAVLGRLARVDQ